MVLLNSVPTFFTALVIFFSWLVPFLYSLLSFLRLKISRESNKELLEGVPHKYTSYS